MDLTGRPLLDNDVDRAIFAGREEEFERLLTATERRLNTLLIGERGAGKTSMLRQLALELRRRHPDSPPPVFVEGGLASDARTFLDLVRHRAGLRPVVTGPSAVDVTRGTFTRKPLIEDSLRGFLVNVPRVTSTALGPVTTGRSPARWRTRSRKVRASDARPPSTKTGG